MKLPKKIDIAPELLFRLRSTYNGSIEVHIEKTGYTKEEILLWEKTGKEVPSKIIKHYQAEYKKPIAFFLLPDLPLGKLKPQKLRTHKNIPQKDFTKDTVLGVEKISQRIELLEDLGLLSDNTIEFDKFEFDSNPKKYASTIRAFLSIDSAASKTKNWLKYWVDHLEKAGVFISQTSLQDKLSGFLFTSKSGNTTIVLDIGEPQTRRLFTLAHELGHFLLARKKRGFSYEAEERYCNSFAGSLLVPKSILVESSEIKRYLGNDLLDGDLLAFAKSYGISPEMALRRLLDEKISPQIDSDFYDSWIKRYEGKGGDYKKSTGGGPLTYYYGVYNEVGHKVSKLLFKARSEGLIDTPTFVSQTGLRSKNIKKFSGVALT